MNVNGKWYTETELQAYVKELESRISELEDKHHNECGQIAHYDDELKAAEEAARKTDLIHEFCKTAAALVEYAKREAEEDFVDGDEVNLSFENKGKRYNICITASEVKDGEQNG